MGLRDRAAYAAWLARRLEIDRPTGLIVAHGDPLFSDDLPDRLAELSRRRLGDV